ncbi:conserved hypothetical protein [Desulfovibrionales bacterium]
MEREIYDRISTIEDRHWWFVGRRRILAAVISRLSLPPNANILDAGCGTGGNLPMLGRFGKVCAFEPDDQARDDAQAKGPFDIRPGFLPHNLPFEPGVFNLVTAFDSLEHMDQDTDCLAALSHMLTTDGYLLATVPAYPFLWSHHDELHHHKRRYYKGKLATITRAAGLRICCLTYYNSLLFPAVAAMRLIKNALGIYSSDDIFPSPLLNHLLLALFTLERHTVCCLSHPPGISLLLLARRA